MTIANTASLADQLCSLLAEEQDSVFVFLARCGSYAGKRGDLARLVCEIAQSSNSRAAELWQLLDELEAPPRPCGVHADRQYLAYLSLQFLLPQLLQAERDVLGRCETARAAAAEHPHARDVLDQHCRQHQQNLDLLGRLSGTH